MLTKINVKSNLACIFVVPTILEEFDATEFHPIQYHILKNQKGTGFTPKIFVSYFSAQMDIHGRNP